MTTHSPAVTVTDRLMNWIWRTPPQSLGQQTRRRVTLRLIPFLFFLYILAYLDRVNTSVALLQMNTSPEHGGVGFTSHIIGLGTALFFWGYWILEIPSTVSVARLGARWVFVRVLILWGICATLLGSIGTPFAATCFGWFPWVRDSTVHQFYVLQFLLGFFEGGFFPSVIVYLSYWFRPEDRGKAIAGFMSAIPLSGVIGMPVSGQLLKADWLGLPGWRWIFIVEGLAPILAAGVAWFYLPNRPEHARWLPDNERNWLRAELEREHKLRQADRHFRWGPKIGMVLLLTSVYFCVNAASYGLGMFMPKMIQVQTGASDQLASLLTGAASLLAFVAMLVNGRHSDRHGERIWHAAVPLAMWGVSLGLAAALHIAPLWSSVVMIVCVGTFMYAHLPAFWPIPTTFLGATAAASAIGFINMVGNLGGSLGRYMVGRLADPTDYYVSALTFLAPWPLAGAIIILFAAYVSRKTSGPRPGQNLAASVGGTLPAAALGD